MNLLRKRLLFVVLVVVGMLGMTVMMVPIPFIWEPNQIAR